MKLTLGRVFFPKPVQKNKNSLTAKSPLTLEQFYKPLKHKPENGKLNNVKERFSLTKKDVKKINSLEALAEEILNGMHLLKKNKKVDLQEFRDMSKAEAGFNYENVVIETLREAKAIGNITNGAGAKASSADADINIFGDIFNVEIKLNSDAQMGGSSVKYSKGMLPELATKLEPETERMLVEAVQSKNEELDKLIEFLATQDPPEINGKTKRFPMTVTKEAWTAAQKAGLLVNTKIPLTTDFIAEHYSKKGIYYIQIGGAGLFYMKENPARLPIPQLQGNIVVEIRTGRTGSKPLSSGISVVGAGIRVQGRLKTKSKSAFTLDDPKKILHLIEAARCIRSKKITLKEATEFFELSIKDET